MISSAQNPKVKNLIKLQEKSSERRKQGLLVFEGARELSLAVGAGFTINTIFVSEEIWGPNPIPDVDPRLVFPISLDVFKKLAYREGSDGLIVVAQAKEAFLDGLNLSDNPFIIVLEGVEKPGNLGAVLRTADAAKADAVIICDPKTDIWNPNVIRSSVGCVFTTQVVSAENEEVFAWLKSNGITPYAAALTATKRYHETPLQLPSAIVMGTEAFGLSDFWLNAAEQIKIPMRGMIDSLNVATSAAIICFEAMRQRGFH